MRNVSRYGDWPEHVIAGLLLIAVAWLRGSKRWMQIGLTMMIACALAGITARGMKIATGRARPVSQTGAGLERTAPELEIQFLPERAHRRDDRRFSASFSLPTAGSPLPSRPSRSSSLSRACTWRRIISPMWSARSCSGFSAPGSARAGDRPRSVRDRALAFRSRLRRGRIAGSAGRARGRRGGGRNRAGQRQNSLE